MLKVADKEEIWSKPFRGSQKKIQKAHLIYLQNRLCISTVKSCLPFLKRVLKQLMTSKIESENGFAPEEFC